MAVPPEVHSGLLAAGPGPGSLLAAAAQWHELSGQYSQAAAELSAIVADVHASSWEGLSAVQFVAAHVPYLAWLEQSALASATTAAQHETVAAAYGTAVATMPTLAELAANHIVNAALVATNFFGLNTIPIAVNEADYACMWIQAADTMAIYQAVAGAATAAVPPTQPAPPIVAPGGEGLHLQSNAPTTPSQPLADLWQFISQLGTTGQVDQMLENFKYFFQQLGFNPATSAVLAFVALWLYDMLWYPYYASYSLLLAPFFAPALSALAALALVNSSVPTTTDPAALPTAGPVAQPVAAAPQAQEMPVVAGVPAGVTHVSTPSSVTATAAAGPAAPAPTVVYAVPGLPQPEVGPGPETDSESPDTTVASLNAVAAARTATATRSRAKRIRRAARGSRGYRDELPEMAAKMTGGADNPSIATAGDSGAGPMGRAGAMRTATSAPAGIVACTSVDESASAPLLPASWRASSEDQPR
ncbi:hypothetical protein BOO86_19100 [Mycobacterium sp. CBMA 234]|uniref:PPE family protein n=1 Tax=Mycolicibacterium sp. CBMA 234 TaxID=1918495 RepID=UPI0012DBED44|nr:PPE family protein [Mycolicibacterium sp. CBMA 234]MUL66591.1 hypothetical protein [Mycolicibacterium sp. CBMA 234]